MPGDQFYRSAAWRQKRAEVLARHPTCQCLGCSRPSAVVDHRRSRRRGGAPFDDANLMALCRRCHSSKTASADGGLGNRAGVWRQCGADTNGRPLDPHHPWNRKPPA